jgi:hypothetical protein
VVVVGWRAEREGEEGMTIVFLRFAERWENHRDGRIGKTVGDGDVFQERENAMMIHP